MSGAQDSELDGVRLDKWLWAARFFKTRGLCTDAVRKGQVRVNKQRPKPARMLRLGDELEIERGEETYRVTVTGFAEKRGSAAVAQSLYLESEASQAQRLEQAAKNRAEWQSRPRPPEQRPDKRARRQLLHFLNEQ